MNYIKRNTDKRMDICQFLIHSGKKHRNPEPIELCSREVAFCRGIGRLRNRKDNETP